MIQLNQKQQAFLENFYNDLDNKLILLPNGRHINDTSVSEFIQNLCDKDSFKAEIVVVIYEEFRKNTEGRNELEMFKKELEGIKENNLDKVIGVKIAKIIKPKGANQPQVFVVYNKGYFEKNNIPNIPLQIAGKFYNMTKQNDYTRQIPKHKFLSGRIFNKLKDPRYSLTISFVKYHL